jgi:hypothetical protein
MAAGDRYVRTKLTRKAQGNEHNLVGSNGESYHLGVKRALKFGIDIRKATFLQTHKQHFAV